MDPCLVAHIPSDPTHRGWRAGCRAVLRALPSDPTHGGGVHPAWTDFPHLHVGILTQLDVIIPAGTSMWMHWNLPVGLRYMLLLLPNMHSAKTVSTFRLDETITSLLYTNLPQRANWCTRREVMVSSLCIEARGVSARGGLTPPPW